MKVHLFVVAGSNRKFATSGSVDPTYVRPGLSWLRLSVPGKGPYSGIRDNNSTALWMFARDRTLMYGSESWQRIQIEYFKS